MAQTGQVIDGLMPEKRDTLTPKGQRLLRAFATVSIVQIDDGREVRFHLSEPTQVQRQILQALGLTNLQSSITGLAQQVHQTSASALA